ncbi:MAG: histidine phosphatase family protein [Geminicoccaceae bacterium]|nr:histidine phosphatase family protein [Geminicoccaceae bacterium]MCX7630335.1 histidine phosphatase family protein [Geminicoccaceae bacterium]MDW8341105.1 histidine phosphatase family protein [Geminicoccaceae bacterium]
MTRLLLVRHAATAWNLERRLQGRTDVPLCPEGRAEIARWRLPRWVERARAWTSPMLRARETAALLGRRDAEVEPRLVEMSWGLWEGRTLRELREADARRASALEALGFDLEPPGGESPRAVAERLAPFFLRLADLGGDHVAVTHKGVIRAAYARASGWDMRRKPPLPLSGPLALLLELDARGCARSAALWPLLDPQP